MTDTSAVSKIVSDIAGRIERGTYKTGQKIPNRRETAERYKTSIYTVSRAYSRLIIEGYLTRDKDYAPIVVGRKPYGVLTLRMFGSDATAARAVNVLRRTGVHTYNDLRNLDDQSIHDLPRVTQAVRERVREARDRLRNR